MLYKTQYNSNTLLVHCGTRTYLVSLDKGLCYFFFSHETIVSSFFYLMVLFYKAFMNHAQKCLFVILLCCKFIVNLLIEWCFFQIDKNSRSGLKMIIIAKKIIKLKAAKKTLSLHCISRAETIHKMWHGQISRFIPWDINNIQQRKWLIIGLIFFGNLLKNKFFNFFFHFFL